LLASIHCCFAENPFDGIEDSAIQLPLGGWELVGADQDAAMDILSLDEFTLSWGEILDDRDDIGGRSTIVPTLVLADGESVTFSFEITDIIAVASSADLPLRFGVLNGGTADSGNIGGFLGHVQWGEPVNFTKAYSALNTNGNVFSMGDQVLEPITSAPGDDNTLTDGNTVPFSLTIARFGENNYGLRIIWGDGEDARMERFPTMEKVSHR
jgi:hypothetical protein